MMIEIWKDSEGYRLLFQDAEFDLTAEAYDKLLASLQDAQAGDEDYRIIHLDLPEGEE